MTAVEVDAIDKARPTLPVKPSFIAAFTLAQIGAYVSFMPLFQVLLPLKAEAIDSAGKAVLLSHVAIFGSITASLANLLAGAISDRTTSRFGRRRPWMVVGGLATVASYFFIMTADTELKLMLGVVGFQLAFNLLFSAMLAVLPDRVPDAQKGRVAAFLSLGHPIGDALLVQAATRLRDCVGAQGLVSRLGGDEFAVVIAPSPGAEALGALAMAIVDTLSDPYDVRGHNVLIGASVGIAVAPFDADDPDGLLKNADLAMYAAKSAGRSRHAWFTPALDERAAARAWLQDRLGAVA